MIKDYWFFIHKYLWIVLKWLSSLMFIKLLANYYCWDIDWVHLFCSIISLLPKHPKLLNLFSIILLVELFKKRYFITEEPFFDLLCSSQDKFQLEAQTFSSLVDTRVTVFSHLWNCDTILFCWPSSLTVEPLFSLKWHFIDYWDCFFGNVME